MTKIHINKVFSCVVQCAVFTLLLSPTIVASPAMAEEIPLCTTLSLLSGPETQFKHLTLDNPNLSSDDNLFELAQSSNAVQVGPTGWPGAWNSSQNDPRVVGATFVSNTALQPATPSSGPDAWNDGSIDQWRLFSHSFTIPDNVTVTNAVVHYTGDDFVNVFLDNSFIATHADFAAVADANLNVTPGTHELEFVLENNAFPRNGSWNPTGLIYRADITYCASNNPPVLSAIGNQTVSENQTLSFTVSASDTDGDNLTYAATNLPSGAQFDPQTQTFSWTPGYNDSGNYENIEFSVSDDGSPMEVDVELITITVGNINRAPEIVSPGAQEILEEEQLQFSIVASDPDNDAITLEATGLPLGASFDAQTGVVTWTPSLSQEGIYILTFTATDNGDPIEVGTIDVVVTVGDNPTPIEQSEDIIEDVVALDLPINIENSYMANLQKVAEFIEQGKIEATINQLQAFINKVNQDYAQGKLTQSQRDGLVDAVEDLISDIE